MGTVLSQPRPGQHQPSVPVFWPWARQVAPRQRPSTSYPSFCASSLNPSTHRSIPTWDTWYQPRPGAPGAAGAVRGRAAPTRVVDTVGVHGHGHGGPRCRRDIPGQPGLEQLEEAVAPSRRARTTTGEGSVGSGGAPTQPRQSTSLGTARLVPRKTGVPGLSRDCGPRAPWVVSELCLPRAPGTVPGDPVTPAPVHPGLFRDIPGYPRSPLPPCAPSRPRPSRVIPGPAPPCAGSCRGPCRAPPAGAGACRTCARDGGERRGAAAGSSGHGAGAQPPRRANPGRDGQPRRRRSRRPVRDAAAPPLPIVRARTRGGPARRDRPTGTLCAAPIRGKGLEDAPGC